MYVFHICIHKLDARGIVCQKGEPMKTLTFKPFARPDGRTALEAVLDGEATGNFIHWIETTTGEACWCSRGDICFSFFSLEEAEATANWLAAQASEGKLFKKVTGWVKP